MADRDARLEDNVPGKFYVDDTCIDCDFCRTTAPDNFTRNDEEGYSYVFKQPENDEEHHLCIEAMEGCPVEAIGDDGGNANEAGAAGESEENSVAPTDREAPDG